MSRTLLLADNSLTIQRVVKLTFADEDISVVTVSDGHHAIEVLNRTPPDIVLADIGMPGASGYAVAQYVRNTPALSHIPVLLLTSAFEPVDQAKAMEVGCDGVLSKPFEPRLVVRRVRELLDKPKSGSPSLESLLQAGSGASRDGTGSSDGGAPPARRPQTSADVERYFETLDQAFATLKTPVPASSSGPRLPASDAARADDAPTLSAAVPPLVDAFTALLAAERSGATGKGPSWPPAVPPQAAAPLAPAVVDMIVGRVLERLRDEVTRDFVSDIVTITAERLVREEIDRIKSNIK